MSGERPDTLALWMARADADWRTAQILLSSGESPPEPICFLLQQHVEKLLKALLTLHGVKAPRTHDLRRLIELAHEVAPSLGQLADDADHLSEHAVITRYPDDWREVTLQEVAKLLGVAEVFRAALLPLLRS